MQPGQSILDVGCGSGILSIIALLLGDENATATDVDVHAVEAAVENARVNGIGEDVYTVLTGDVISDEAFRHEVGEHKFDMVLANIFAEIIIPLSGVVKEMMKPGALFITSGIIDEREEDVRKALTENGFEIMEVTHSGGWVSFTAKA
jgi:ribosomal protein L11 methyltransferase